jgi:hypothetical protein
MIGIVDVLEYELKPFIVEWRKSYEMTGQTAPK